MPRKLLAAALASLMLIGGCGGGGDSQTTPPPPREPITVTQEQLATPVNKGSRYLLYLPRDYGQDPERRWPLIVFMHGSQPFSNLTLENLSQQGVMGHMNDTGQGLPAIVVQTQQDVNNHGDPLNWHDPVFVDAVIRDVEARFTVDRTRVSITGGSLGGFGSWSMALAYPRRFAAVMPVVGGLSNDSASYNLFQPLTGPKEWGTVFRRLKDTPFRVYAATNDQAVEIGMARNPVSLLSAVSGSRLDYREGTDGHGGTQDVAFNSEPIAWMLAQSRPDADASPDPLPQASDYTGSYHFKNGQPATVSYEDGQLVVSYQNGAMRTPFLPMGDDRFMGSWLMIAQRDRQGQVKCLSTPMFLLPTLLKNGSPESCQ